MSAGADHATAPPADLPWPVAGWRPAVTGERADAAVAVALDVAHRLADGDHLEAAYVLAPRQSSRPETLHWESHGIGQGDAGIALTLAHVDRCFPGRGWDRAAHESLTRAARSAERVGLGPGLYSGLAGLAFTTHLLSRDGGRYARLAESLEESLVPRTHRLAETLHLRAGGLPTGEYDVISGLAGIGGALLAQRTDAAVGAALKHTLDALCGLLTSTADGVPAWLTPSDLLADPSTAERFPHGALNCGLAHGLPGPVALLALAQAAGAPVPALPGAIETAANWLTDHRRDDEWGVNWPSMLPPPGAPDPWHETARAAWCYGAPGVARALWLAGRALSDEALCALAVDAMRAVHRRPLPARRIDGPGLCHGVAGLLQITLRFWHDTGLPDFQQAAATLVDQLLDAHDPGSVLGFRNVEWDGTLVDAAGLLDGAPGVALALLAATTPVEPAWDRILLVA